VVFSIFGLFAAKCMDGNWTTNLMCLELPVEHVG
jgi:hypothetical protein